MRTCDKCGKPAILRLTVDTVTGDQLKPAYLCAEHVEIVGLTATPAMWKDQDWLDALAERIKSRPAIDKPPAPAT